MSRVTKKATKKTTRKTSKKTGTQGRKLEIGVHAGTWTGKTYLALLNAKKAISKAHLVEGIGQQATEEKLKRVLWKIRAVDQLGQKSGLFRVESDDNGNLAIKWKSAAEKKKHVADANA